MERRCYTNRQFKEVSGIRARVTDNTVLNQTFWKLRKN